MRMADKMSALRIILAPLFFAVYFIPGAAGMKPWLSIAALWVIFIVSELTDMFDGMIARKRGEVSDFGKLFDPFADTLVQLTYFLCFVLDGLLPAVLYIAVLYREFSMLFLRNLMLKKGVALGARMGGKIKTVTYIAACALALLASSLKRLGFPAAAGPVTIAAISVFAVSVLLAALSFFDYLKVYRNS